MPMHPKISPDEIFVGNTDAGGVPNHLESLRTARVATPAYDIYGNKLPGDHKALIVGRSEADAYDRIMMARMPKR